MLLGPFVEGRREPFVRRIKNHTSEGVRCDPARMVFILAMLLAHSGRGENPGATDQEDVQGRSKIVSLTLGGMPELLEREDETLLIDGRKMTSPRRAACDRHPLAVSRTPSATFMSAGAGVKRCSLLSRK